MRKQQGEQGVNKSSKSKEKVPGTALSSFI
jgi:hypothetical protein